MWYKTYFATPTLTTSSSSFLMNAVGLGRGHYYINGHDLGRYWTLEDNSGTGALTQQYYFIPVDYLNAVGGDKNLFVIAEVEGATSVGSVSFAEASMVSGSAPAPPDGNPWQSCVF